MENMYQELKALFFAIKAVGINTCKKVHRLGIAENANATEQQVLNNCDEIIVESIIQ